METAPRVFNGIKTGDWVRIPLRTRLEKKYCPSPSYTVCLLQEGGDKREVKSLGVISDAKVQDDMVDIKVVSYYKKGHKVGDGQVVVYMLYSEFRR